MIAFPGDWWIGSVAIPVEWNRHTLENNDEDVEHVENGDDSKKSPNRDTLPLLTRADSKKKEADDKFDEDRDEYIDTLPDVFPKECRRMVVYWDIHHMLTETPTN